MSRWSIALVVLVAGCDSRGDAAFGERCSTSDDCAAGICAGGEAPGGRAFCSEDCSGKPSGASCGGGRGKCVADFVSWCWLPCESDAECSAVNAERPTCARLSSSGKDYPFKVCSTATRVTDAAAD